MNRLAATIRLDAKLQARNLLYVVGIGLALAAGGVAGQLLGLQAVRLLLPAIFLGTIGGTAYVFAAGMVLFEKNERTLDALSVSPLPSRIYVVSKVVTLGGFATLECTIILLLAHGVQNISVPMLLAAVLCMGAVFTLVGIGQVVSYDSITDFLVPWGILVTAVLELPLLHYLQVWPHPIWYLVPSQAQLILMKAAMQPIELWEWVYGVGYTALALAAAYWFALARFKKHIRGK